MSGSGLPVPVAALLSAVFAATAAAQGPARDAIVPPAGAGNPLWTIALDELAETHARPLFSPSRRPPAPAVVAALPAPAVEPASATKSELDHPLLTLLGTIASDSVEIGVFSDDASHDVIRIRAGEAHDGWTLSAICGRVAIFQKQGHSAATLALPAAGVDAAKSRGGPPAITFVPPVIPAAVKGGSRRPPREG